jgi:hypothetical protein
MISRGASLLCYSPDYHSGFFRRKLCAPGPLTEIGPLQHDRIGGGLGFRSILGQGIPFLDHSGNAFPFSDDSGSDFPLLDYSGTYFLSWIIRVFLLACISASGLLGLCARFLPSISELLTPLH